mmetsp:Transcript_8236/g.18517  ORF Transcript_8236/g.18517 Transcript_8236/m.18517 type:complete len:374 (+) Transcript_8236:24-1145(+)
MAELNWDAPWCVGEIATVQDCFHRVSVLATGDQGWDHLQGHGECHQQVLRVSRDVSFYRTQSLVDIPTAAVEDLLRPESGNGLLSGHFDGFRAVKQIAPGDLMVSRELTANPTAQPQAPTATCHVRYVMRRECPSGQVAFVVAPCDETGECLWEERSFGTARFVSLSAVDGGERTLVTEIIRLYCVPEPAIKLHVGTLNLPALLLAQQPPRDPGFTSVPSQYMVVCIRRCGRGPPLLPLTAELNTWECAERSGFSLPRYLVRFAGVMGLDLQAWDALDGRQLAPFQAAVRVDQWATSWPQLETGFRAQCRAYRSVNRISAAPTLVEGVEPRFVKAPAPAASEHLLRGLEVRHTFIDAQRPSPPARRCSSLPPA